MTLNNTRNAISSPELVSRHTHCVMQDGLITSQSGQEATLVSLSARQAKEKDLLTSGTCGPRSFTSSSSENLTLSLVNRLQAKTASTGSTLYKLIWKQRTTPQQHLIYALRASVRRASDKDCIGWPDSYRSGLEGWQGMQCSDQIPASTCGVADNDSELNSFWQNTDWLFCKDGKRRPVEPGTFPLVDGITDRVGRLRAYGNAIVAPVAEEFVRAYLEANHET
ncbi:hypothetical protein ARAF_0515 [Arsenophonus endosymbiont of Aleurodicus floccissimus]|nr:hypothetical protein ARAF_0515 [Arsenophonus endosymbiont of Aleurodicus floccissimus]